jgi:hypothetical protein
MKKELPPLTPQRKRKAKPQEQAGIKTPKLSKCQPQIKNPTPKQKNPTPTNFELAAEITINPKSRKIAPKNLIKQTQNKKNKIWMEFTQLNGKLILMKTIDIGVRHSTRKPKPKATGNKPNTTPQPEVPPTPLPRKITKKFAQIDLDPDTPRRKILKARKIRETSEPRTPFPPPRKLRQPSASKMNNIYEKETAARTAGEGAYQETRMHLSQETSQRNSPKGTSYLINFFENNKKSTNSNSSAVGKADIQTFGREQIEPMRCTETLLPRLELSVTKNAGKVQHPDWSRNRENIKISGIQQIRGGDTE